MNSCKKLFQQKPSFQYSFTPERVRRYHLNRSDYLNEEIRHSQRAIRNALLGYKHASNSRKTCRTDLLDTTWILENLELVGRQLPRESSSQGNPNQESVQELHRQICQLFEDDALAVCERGHNQEVALDLASQVIATHMRTIREFQEEYFKVTGKKHELKKLEVRKTENFSLSTPIRFLKSRPPYNILRPTFRESRGLRVT